MSENVTPLTTEHLCIMRDDIALFRADITKKVDEGFSDVRKRLTHVEHSILGLKRDEVDTATEITEHRQLFDRLQSTIEQMQKRIDSLEAHATH